MVVDALLVAARAPGADLSGRHRHGKAQEQLRKVLLPSVKMRRTTLMEQGVPIRVTFRRRCSEARIILLKQRQIYLAPGPQYPPHLGNGLTIARRISMIRGVVVHDTVKAVRRKGHLEQVAFHRIDR